MFCIIEGRIQGYSGRTGLLPKTHYLCGFWRFTIYISIGSFLIYHLQLHLPFAFSDFVSIHFFYFLPTFHSTRSSETTHPSFSFTLSSPFGPYFCVFPKTPFNQFFSNDPASVGKILVEFVFFGVLQALL